MSLRTLLIVGGLLAGAGSAVAIWIVSQSGPPREAGEAATAISTPSDAERRERAEKFLGGNPNLDVRGGQEMRPRW
ncbi:entry exclusion protein TrbK [Chelatococcus asaccharovorans]|uniref:entry exclusion protein TrbK n=1 Tax=Chelatococcus asaccharovorans TaxID=28210 RepID=UPI00224C63F7|nr:entry exclusion protein TrbK [Chelatococcus asaccharovorans]CAH1661149.1 Conjugal transfer protein TrbK [Chelatococcus asaccharovorans]CAH1689990.1 Conjugal transfer protein TrbK [Chelatococcus asaccharovorans]